MAGAGTTGHTDGKEKGEDTTGTFINAGTSPAGVPVTTCTSATAASPGP